MYLSADGRYVPSSKKLPLTGGSDVHAGESLSVQSFEVKQNQVFRLNIVENMGHSKWFGDALVRHFRDWDSIIFQIFPKNMDDQQGLDPVTNAEALVQLYLT